MDHKDIWLVLGLTVILAVAVSVSTVSLTGDAIFSNWGKKVTSIEKTPKINVNTIQPVTYEGVKDILNKAIPITDSNLGSFGQTCNKLCNDPNYNSVTSKNKCIIAMSERRSSKDINEIVSLTAFKSCDYTVQSKNERLNCLCA